ncbi:hypothetical protein [Portibacter lacus]|uniref:Tetratricopeptide repeat protein n=1 Tax=Portibacter lacus TaxID=1099794 RepID=A0AA37WGE0_9BACT|nr:hypothetical protein [Portibacter lacus]GLR19647.1 hypothetical protein GCM10007940_42630 [Portibacter lacus]
MEEKNMAYYLEDLNRVHNLSFEKLGEWKEKFPYAQAVHFLMAKKHQLEGFIDDMDIYHKASFYAVDRTFLQERMTRSETELGSLVEEAEDILEEEVEEIEEVVEVATSDSENIIVEEENEEVAIPIGDTDESENVDDTETLSDFASWINSLGDQSSESSESNQIKKKKKKKKKKQSKLAQKIEASVIKKDEIISEPLAQILAQQGHIEKAKLMYEKLSLIFPEKSSFFALQIEKIINSK